MRSPKDIEKDEYNEFYKKTFNEFMEPLAHAHFTTEACYEFCLSQDETMSISFRNLQI